MSFSMLSFLQAAVLPSQHDACVDSSRMYAKASGRKIGLALLIGVDSAIMYIFGLHTSFQEVVAIAAFQVDMPF